MAEKEQPLAAELGTAIDQAAALVYAHINNVILELDELSEQCVARMEPLAIVHVAGTRTQKEHAEPPVALEWGHLHHRCQGAIK